MAENKAKYTVSDYQRAVKARTIQKRIGRPSTKRYMELANAGRILNCDVTGQDILNAEDIFGPEIGSLKGKTVRSASEDRPQKWFDPEVWYRSQRQVWNTTEE